MVMASRRVAAEPLLTLKGDPTITTLEPSDLNERAGDLLLLIGSGRGRPSYGPPAARLGSTSAQRPEQTLLTESLVVFSNSPTLLPR